MDLETLKHLLDMAQFTGWSSGDKDPGTLLQALQVPEPTEAALAEAQIFVDEFVQAEPVLAQRILREDLEGLEQLPLVVRLSQGDAEIHNTRAGALGSIIVARRGIINPDQAGPYTRENLSDLLSSTIIALDFLSSDSFGQIPNTIVAKLKRTRAELLDLDKNLRDEETFDQSASRFLYFLFNKIFDDLETLATPQTLESQTLESQTLEPRALEPEALDANPFEAAAQSLRVGVYHLRFVLAQAREFRRPFEALAPMTVYQHQTAPGLEQSRSVQASRDGEVIRLRLEISLRRRFLGYLLRTDARPTPWTPQLAYWIEREIGEIYRGTGQLAHQFGLTPPEQPRSFLHLSEAPTWAETLQEVYFVEQTLERQRAYLQFAHWALAQEGGDSLVAEQRAFLQEQITSIHNNGTEALLPYIQTVMAYYDLFPASLFLQYYFKRVALVFLDIAPAALSNLRAAHEKILRLSLGGDTLALGTQCDALEKTIAAVRARMEGVSHPADPFAVSFEAPLAHRDTAPETSASSSNPTVGRFRQLLRLIDTADPFPGVRLEYLFLNHVAQNPLPPDTDWSYFLTTLPKVLSTVMAADQGLNGLDSRGLDEAHFEALRRDVSDRLHAAFAAEQQRSNPATADIHSTGPLPQGSAGSAAGAPATGQTATQAARMPGIPSTK